MPYWKRFAVVVFGLLTALPVFAQEIKVETSRQGEFILIEASAELRADVRTAWEVLTDYDHLADFIPDMKSSRVIVRTPDGVIVEQKGEFGFLFFTQPLDVNLAVTETPRRRIVSRGITGPFKELAGAYELEPTPEGVRLHYSGRMVPDFELPPLFGMYAMRAAAKKRFAAMAQEIVKRAARTTAKSSP